MKPGLIWQKTRLIWFESEDWLGQLGYVEGTFHKLNESNLQNQGFEQNQIQNWQLKTFKADI